MIFWPRLGRDDVHDIIESIFEHWMRIWESIPLDYSHFNKGDIKNVLIIGKHFPTMAIMDIRLLYAEFSIEDVQNTFPIFLSVLFKERKILKAISHCYCFLHRF